jgi:large subunit ribosomal protein L25
METIKLAIETRVDPGKGPAKRLRERGRVPGVVYGRGESLPVSFDTAALRQVLAHGRNIVLELEYPADVRGVKHLTVIKEMQRHPVSGALLHVDLQEVQTGQEIDASVSVEITGMAPGVEAGGMLDQVLREVVCHGQPTNMPAAIEVDVSALEMGHHILLSDLVVPEGCTIVGDPDQLVVTVLSPRVVQEEVVAEEEVVEEPKV